MNFRTSLFLVITCIISGYSQQKCVIDGTVVGKTKAILLVGLDQDFQRDDVIEIPVMDNRFHYETTLDAPMAYDLMLAESRESGGGAVMPLFLEKGKIDLVIHTDNFPANAVIGRTLNKKYTEFKNSNEAEGRMFDAYNKINLLKEEHKYYAANSKTDLTAEAASLEAQLDSAIKKRQQYLKEYIAQSPDMVGYYVLLCDLRFFKEIVDPDFAQDVYATLSKANPGHPYNALAMQAIESMQNIAVGKKYIDFIAPDLNSNLVKLSDKIRGKVVLLDLWATWCASCIEKTRSIRPVYEKYKDKGFTIVGIAGERKNTDRLHEFLAKEQWPWLQLVELDKRSSIWAKYGVPNAGGSIFLIGKEGEILAINPTAEELESQLKQLFE